MTPQEAVDRATEYNGGPLIQPKVHAEKPLNVYASIPTQEDCWYIMSFFDDQELVLTSSRLIMVSTTTGKIIFDGDASGAPAPLEADQRIFNKRLY